MKKKQFQMFFKLLIATQIFIIFFGCGGSEEKKVFYDNGNLKEKYYVKKIDDNFLKHGEYLSWHENGMKKQKGAYVKGKRDGKWEGWFDDGTKRMTIHFTEGMKTGEWSHFGNSFKSKINYKDDLLDGKLEASINFGFKKATIRAEFKNGVPVNDFFIKEWEDEPTDEFWKNKDFDYLIKGQISPDGKINISESDSFEFMNEELYLNTERTHYTFSRGFKHFFYSDYGIGEAINCFGSGFFDTILYDSIAKSERN